MHKRTKQRQIDTLSLRDGRPWGEAVTDILSMYFPITFKPPPNDPYGITQPMLSAVISASAVLRAG